MKLSQLEALVGAEQLIPPEQNSYYRLVGVAPLPVVRVRTLEQLAEVVRFAAKEKLALLPVGGGTKLEIGNLPRQADLFLSTSLMDLVLAHEAADLTTTVQAGCTLERLQETISQQGQFLPIDAPYSRRATIGGVVATASHGSLRFSLGTPRDWLIGIKVVNADGKITKAGGKVVKNVAGYDLMKLYTGSFGTLAVIAELNFKLRPRPAADATLIGVFNDRGSLFQAVARLTESQLLPAALDLISAGALASCFPEANIGQADYPLAARFLGSPEAVAAQCQYLLELWGKLAREVISITTSSAQSWRRVVDFPEQYQHQICLRIAVLPTQLQAMLALIEQELAPLAKQWQMIAQMNGIVRVFLTVEEEFSQLELTRWQRAVATLRAFCVVEKGAVVIERAPLEMKRQIDAWGDPPAAVALMRTIKDRLDPINIFNPGRFVAGL
ncbi:MAG: FAD-binding oxidoreductase [Acidobacteriota bacterium]